MRQSRPREDVVTQEHRRAAVPLVLIALALAACAVQAPPPPPTPPPQTRLEPQPIPPSGVHVVRSGDTLSEIADDYGLNLEELARANGILDGDRIQAGRRLALQWPRPIEVAGPPLRAQRPQAATATARPPTAPLRVVVTPPTAAEEPATATLPKVRSAHNERADFRSGPAAGR
jgi:lipoprotein NlpD